MLILLSPSKSLEYDTRLEREDLTTPYFNKEAKELIGVLKQYSAEDIGKLMSISENLSELNHDRYQNFKSRHTDSNSNAAIHAFRGDVYIGLDIDALNDDDIIFANEHVRILSGLYGLLRPLDRMQPYRLEMGTKLKTSKGKNLYDFWGTEITEKLNRTASGIKADYIVNLASNEYFKSIKKKLVKKPIIDIDFREERGGELKFISFNAKKARGTMTRYIIKNRIDTVEGLKGFDLDDYRYEESGSSENQLLFVR